MKMSFFSSLGCLLAIPGVLYGQSLPQRQISLTPGAAGSWNADWEGVAGRTYFIKWSLDLVNWQYFPSIDYGIGIKSAGFNSTSSKYFIRLLTVDDTTVQTLQRAKDADFDNDGIPNLYEVQTLGTDPLDKNSAGGDIDGDGLPDGWEKYYFGVTIQVFKNS